MKKEDLMKHCKEEKQDLKKEIIIKTFFFFLFINQFLFSQIPLDGFCKLEEIKIQKNFNKIFPFDFNNDGYKDLIIYSPNEKKYITIKAVDKSNFDNPVLHTSSYSISVIKSQSDIYLGKKVGALLNNSKEISIITFNRSGSINFNNKEKLNGFASSIDISKNVFGKLELITSGAGIDGLKIYHEKNSRISFFENIKGKQLSHVTFCDFNYDSFDDILAFDINSNSLVFYYNNHYGDYDEQRSIGINGLVKDIQTVDVNSDRFTDIILNVDGKLNFFIGDSVSSFQKNTKFNFDSYVVNAFNVFDYNADGINDIAFINEDKNEIKISFGKGNNQFYQPITLLNKNNLTDLISYFDRSGRKLSVVSSDGNVYVISKIFLNDNDFQISLANNTNTISTFDYSKDGYKDLCWIDNFSTLNIALSERKNLFAKYYKFALQSDCDNLTVDDSKPESKIFVAYKSRNKNIEIVYYNFKSESLKRKIIYSKYKIEELKIYGDKFKDRFVVNIITRNKNEIFLERFEYVNFNLLNKETEKISENVVASSLGIYGGKSISTFDRINNSFELNMFFIGNNSINKNNRLKFQVLEKDNVTATISKVEQLFSRSYPLISLININNNLVLYLFTENKNFRYNLNYKYDNSKPIKYLVEESSLEVYFFDITNKLIKLTFDEKYKLVDKNETKFNYDLKSYTVEKFDVQNKYLIFANNNSLTLKKL
ncbi:MAG: VCBS repeat-containing protein [Melioribacteraceae bacterium]|nr:VCBS repeat-containing protein [Melioribacteraceae bacterium]